MVFLRIVATKLLDVRWNAVLGSYAPAKSS
jgi:hypothetical protein